MSNPLDNPFGGAGKHASRIAGQSAFMTRVMPGVKLAGLFLGLVGVYFVAQSGHKWAVRTSVTNEVSVVA